MSIFLLYPLVTGIALLTGGVLFALCYALFRLWKPLPTVIGWWSVLWLGSGYFNLWGFVANGAPMIIMNLLGAYFFAASTLRPGWAKYIWAYAALFPLGLLCMSVDGMLEFALEKTLSLELYVSGKSQPFYSTILVVQVPNLCALIVWWHRRGARLMAADKAVTSLDAPKPTPHET